nr:30S ribosomal protein S1, chloroplastic [Ipomoea batatas]
MPFLLHPCNCSIFNPNFPLFNSVLYTTAPQFPVILTSPKYKTPNPHSGSSKNLSFSSGSSNWRRVQAPLCSKQETYEEPGKLKSEELELLNKPSPKPIDDQPEVETLEESKKPSKDELLEPFHRLFSHAESLDENHVSELDSKGEAVQEEKKVTVEYFEPKPGDFVVGVVVSGNDRKLDVNIGADLLGVMLTKDVLPLHGKEMGDLLCDLEKDAEKVMVGGKVGIVKNDEALGGEPLLGKPVVDPGTVLFAEVLGRTLSGRPLLSSRRLFRRMAWHRVRQIKHLNEPIEVKITEWNTGGLLTRIEGLRAFLPKAELLNRVNSFRELKENVGRRIHVLIARINEETNDLILTEKEAWNMLNLQEGKLLEGTVWKIFPHGAQIRIGETNRSGILHISNITKGRITSVGDLLAVNEKVKVLVVKSMFPDKISLSIADLESEPGLFLSNKEKVFSEAEWMAKRYRQGIPASSMTRKREPLPTNSLPFEDGESMYANWKWFKFQKDNEESTP